MTKKRRKNPLLPEPFDGGEGGTPKHESRPT